MAFLILQHSALTGPRRFAESIVAHGAKIDPVLLHEGEPLPTSLSSVDGLIVMGGPQSPEGSEMPWLEKELDLIRRAHERQLPIVGICLGSQLVAMALGGEVSKMDNGIELGWHDVTFTPGGREDPLHAGLGWSLPMAHWHRFAVSKLPPDARLLARSEHCGIQAWALGLRTYCYQFHPEVDAQTMIAWANDDPQDLADAGVSLEQLRTDTQTHYADFERRTNRLFDQLTLLLLAPDRRFAGLVKDLHH
jgi:GMP synthase (glutamine-hydrolysing)